MNVAVILGIIIAMIVTPIALAIGVTVAFQVTGSIDTVADSYAENAINQVEANAYTGFNLGSLLTLVIAAVGIISVIVTGFLGLMYRPGQEQQ